MEEGDKEGDTHPQLPSSSQPTADVQLLDEDFARIRAWVLGFFGQTARAPSVEDLMVHYNLKRRKDAVAWFDLLHARHAILQLSSNQILMAWPFSNLQTPHRACDAASGLTYYGNCPWDIFGIHFILDERPLQGHTRCHQSGQLISLSLRHGQPFDLSPPTVLFYYAKPVREWYGDLVDTCHNAILAFASAQHLEQWKAEQLAEIQNKEKAKAKENENEKEKEKEKLELQRRRFTSGQTVSVEQIIILARGFYAGRMQVDWEGNSVAKIARIFKEAKLEGKFWAIEEH